MNDHYALLFCMSGVGRRHLDIPPSQGTMFARVVKPFNKTPRPEGSATPEQKAARGPKKGKGTRRSRKR